MVSLPKRVEYCAYSDTKLFEIRRRVPVPVLSEVWLLIKFATILLTVQTQ